MQISSAPQPTLPCVLKETPKQDPPEGPKENQGKGFNDFYERYETPINIGGGALIGAGIARLAGLPSEAVMSAAGSGALAGFFAGSKEKALLMAGGAALGAGIATLAGVPAAGIVGAAGTGTLVAFIFG